MIISDDFKWNLYIDTVTSKAYQKLGMIRKTLQGAPSKIKFESYLVLCRPFLEYASKAWDPVLRKLVEKLERVQKQALRFVCGSRGVESVMEARKSLGILTLKGRRKQAHAKLMLQILVNSRHSELQKGFNITLTSSSSNLNFNNTKSVIHGGQQAQTAHYDFLHNGFITSFIRPIF